MKKIIFLILFFFSIGQVNAILVPSNINNYNNPSCFTSDNKYFFCVDDLSWWGNVYGSLYSATWALISNTDAMYDWASPRTMAIRSVIVWPQYDIITMQDNYVNENFFSQGAWICIINKLSLWMTCYNVGTHNFNSAGVPWFSWVEITWDTYYAYWYSSVFGYQSLNLTTMEWGTNSPPWINLNYSSKIYFLNNYIFFKNWNNDLIYSRKIEWQDANYQYSNIPITSYIYKDWFLSNGISLLDSTNWITQVYTGSIINYELSLTLANTMTWILDWVDIVNNQDIYTTIINDEINNAKISLDTPLILKNNTNVYYIDSQDNQLYVAWYSGLSYSIWWWWWWNWTGWTNTGSLNLNFNCDTDNSWDIWIGEGLYCPIIRVKWLAQTFLDWLNNFYTFVYNFTKLSPNIP